MLLERLAQDLNGCARHLREFIKEAARSGIDVFRVFDSLNWLPGMEVAMDEVLKQDKICLLYTSPSPRDCS